MRVLAAKKVSNRTRDHNFARTTSMNYEGIEALLSKAMKANNEKLCPECGARMTESDRFCENNAIFVWFKCSDSNCGGQVCLYRDIGKPAFKKIS
jgi:hypothetical protein